MADDALRHLEAARTMLDKREHPALTAIEIADAMRYLETIKRLMSEAKNGVE
jgi:hypothetical protein